MPAQVRGINASQGTLYGQTALSWSSSVRVASYDLYRSTTSGTKGSAVATSLNATSYDDDTISGTTYYFYTVVAKNGTGNAPDSLQAEGWGELPVAVNTLIATQGTVVDAVQLNWSAVTDATSYNRYRATISGDTLTLLGTSTTTAYTDSTTGAGTAYYKVSAVVGSIEDPAGNKAMGYSWQMKGQPIDSTSYRISFSKTGTPQSASVTITSIEGAKEFSTPVSINVNY